MIAEWVRYWSRMGDACMSRADGELEARQFSRACDSYLAATEFYWLALSRTSRRVPEHRLLADAHVSAFRTAVPLLCHPATPFDLTVGKSRATGYLFRPVGGTALCRPVVWPVQSEATAESSYRQVALAILGSDLACAVYSVDEGQSRRGDPGCPAPTDAVQRAVVQWVRHQPGVDPDAEALQAPSCPERN